MRTKHILYFALLGVIAGSATAHASALITVSLDTTPLAGHAAGPFSLFMQFLDGEGIGNANNSALVSNIQFGGGAATGTPFLTGGAAGDLSSIVTLQDSGFINLFEQEFLPGTNLLFSLLISTDPNPGGTPDRFSLAILDSLGVEIPTQAFYELGADILMYVDVGGGGDIQLRTYGTDPTWPPFAGGDPILIDPPLAVQEIPEPGTLALAAVGLFVAAGFLRLRRGNPMI